MRTTRSKGAPTGGRRRRRRARYSPPVGGGSIDDETKANEDTGRRGRRRLRRAQHGHQPVGRLRGQRLRRRRRRRRRSSAATSTTRSSRRTSPGRASAPARSTSSSRTGVTRTWRSKFFAEKGDGTATDFGPQGNVGIIGWFVPPWLAEEHPDILDYNNLNKYAKEFATSESGGKGQFLGADPSYVQFDEAIVSNLGLDFKVVFSGSEAASIEAFRKAEENKEFLIGYFYEPQYFIRRGAAASGSRCRRTRTAARTTRRRSRATTPRPILKKIVSTEWAESGSSSVDLVQNFSWTNEDQNVVAGYISADGMSPRGGRGQVGRGQPGQGRGLARLSHRRHRRAGAAHQVPPRPGDSQESAFSEGETA